MTRSNIITGEMKDPRGWLSPLNAAILRISASQSSQTLADRLIKAGYPGIRVQSFSIGA